jgi:hypothetical protein
LRLSANIRSLAAMGVGALVLQQLTDFAFGIFLRGSTPAQQLAHLAMPAGLNYVALLIAFMAMPIVVNRPQRQASIRSG